MIPKFRFFGRVADGETRMLLAEAIDFTSRFVYYSYHDYTVEGDDNVYGDTISFENCVIMQSTGLKDKNGKEIYEGDIIKCSDGHDYYFGVVAYDKDYGNFGVIEDNDEDVSSFCFLFEWKKVEELEVIGNIYENKELFEEK